MSENLAAGPGEDLIVKYLSALLLVQPKCDNIIRLIEAQIHAGKDAELELNKAELVCKKAKCKCKKEELVLKDLVISALRVGIPLSPDLNPQKLLADQDEPKLALKHQTMNLDLESSISMSV